VSAVRICITGIGIVSALAPDAEGTWARLIAGDRGIGPVTLFDTTGHRSSLGAEVKTPLPLDGPSWSRTSQMARLAAREAIGQARLDVRSRRVGMVIAGTTGGMFETEALLAQLSREADSDRSVVWEQMLSHPLTATGDVLEKDLGPFVRMRTLASACSSGANALAVAAMWLLSGEVDAVVAGASEGLCRLTYGGFHALAAMDPEPCRPFDQRRRGLTLGEGAGFVVLERDHDAAARGVGAIADLAGWAVGSEAHHITNPEATGETAARLISRAIASAGVTPADVGYVNAHGTGTPLNDSMETRALHRALGEHVHRVRVSSVKGQLGHTLGASGAIEAIIAALAISRGKVPATIGLEEVDPECRLRHVRSAEEANVEVALSSSFGFGGMDTVLALTRPGRGRGREMRTLGDGGRDSARRVVVTAAASLENGTITDARGRSVKTDAALGAIDPARGRRLDRASRLPLATALFALEGQGGITADAVGADVGIAWGSAFGRVDASAAYMHRLFDKGPRFASPAEFPNLVPSSPTGHASIYLGTRGPVMTLADLGTSAESAVLQAIETLVTGEATRMIAGAVEPPETIVNTVLSKLFAAGAAPRVEAGGILWLANEDARDEPTGAEALTALARVERAIAWRGAPSPLPSPSPVPHLCVARALDEASRAAIVAAGWELPPGDTLDSDAAGGVALVEGVRAIALGQATEVLVVGSANQRGYAFVLVAP
jgi:3-oxoacyl-[acyl-carrier-protein] synthase II